MGSAPMKILFSCEDFSEKSFASLINRARRRAPGSYQALPIQSLDAGDNREKDSNSQNEGTSGGRSPRPTHRRARRCRTKRISPRPAADKAGGTKRTHNPVQLMPPRFEHEHDDEHEDDLVASTPRCASVVNPLRGSGFGTQSSSSRTRRSDLDRGPNFLVCSFCPIPLRSGTKDGRVALGRF